ncbi:MAG: aldo/keto reductase [Pseudonocardia sp.]|nr:aldo/keto reductase [Pseudonocardia sp.]
MRTTTMGRKGPEVSVLGLGTMTFGAETEQDEAHRMLDTFVDAGGTLLDCADVYADGRSEEIVGRWLERDGNRTRVRIATKGRFAVTGQPGASLRADYLRYALDRSLARLRISDVDIYQVHGPDRSTPLDEVAGFFAEALQSGRVGYVGLSNLPGWQIATLAALLDDERLICHQTQYSLLVREPEWEIFPAARHAGLGCLAWGPLAAGWLTGKYERGIRPTGASRLGKDPNRGLEAWERRGTDRTWTIIDGLREHADRLRRTPADLALSWLVGRPGVTAALVGARSTRQLVETVGGLGAPLTDEIAADLDLLSAPAVPDYPYAFLAELDPAPEGER